MRRHCTGFSAFSSRWRLAAPIVCQDEATPYFSLSSNRTFGSHDQPTIMLSGWHVPAVQIRVYRVKDATSFFRQIEDAHSFGGHMPRRQPGKKTLIERIHDWKSGFVEMSGTNCGASSANRRALSSRRCYRPRPRPPPGTTATYFAASARAESGSTGAFACPAADERKQAWSSARVPIEVKGQRRLPGGGSAWQLSARTPSSWSRILCWSPRRDATACSGFLADRDTGEPIANASIAAMTRNGQPTTLTTNSDGLANLPKTGHCRAKSPHRRDQRRGCGVR